MTTMRIASGLGLLLGLGLAAGQAQAQEGDAQRGEQAAGACVACHQADGSGMNVSGGGVLAAPGRAAGGVHRQAAA